MSPKLRFWKKLRKHVKASAQSAEAEEGSALTEVYCGKNPVVDIVAVHGLKGNSVNTFTFPSASTESGRFWLGDADMLPRDIENCRVLTYDYNATLYSILGSASSDRILQHAHTLIAELVADRDLNAAMERPIIFICHSLGGIVVKRALVYSASRTSHRIEHLHSIYVSTYGVMFMGTPHLGTDTIHLALFAERLIHVFVPSKIMDTNSQFLDALKEGSDMLQEVTDNFVPLMKRFRIYFFWEQDKTNFGTKWEYVVPEASAAPILDNTDRAGLRGNHREIGRFASRNAPGYKLVVASLRRYSRDAPDAISRRWQSEKAILLSMRQNEAADLLRTSPRESESPQQIETPALAETPELAEIPEPSEMPEPSAASQLQSGCETQCDT